MDEEKATKEKKPETPTEPEDAGSKYETTPVIERAREEREKLEAANKERERLLDREEQIMAKRALGGMSEAGQAPAKPEEISDEEYTNQVMSGVKK